MKNFFAKTFTLIFACFLFSVPALAEPTLDEVCASLSKYPVTTGNFVQEKTLPSLKRALRSSGTFILCPQGMVWNTEKPIASVLAITESKIIQTAPDGSKSVLDGSENPIFLSVAETVSSLFKGDKVELERHFAVDFATSSSSWKLTLLPKDKNISSVMKTVTLSGFFGKGDIVLEGMEIFEQTGGTIRYTFTNQVHKNELSAKEVAYFAQ